jgi:tyrosyl-tRNA synthetase
MATYRDQVTPFFDFTRASFRYNSEWLAPTTLPEFIGALEKLPVAASLQREDFRNRLAAGSGLTMAELVYSVVMALMGTRSRWCASASPEASTPGMRHSERGGSPP